jgi:hypothetical protein
VLHECNLSRRCWRGAQSKQFGILCGQLEVLRFRLGPSGVLPIPAIHNALLHHKEHFFGLANARKRIAGYGDNVSEFSRLQSACFGGNTKQAGVY